MTPTLLSDLLAKNAEKVCSHLLPKGRKRQGEWVCGDSSGNAGESLKIALTGEKVGVGCDFATGETFGDLLDVWQATQRVGLAQAMEQACTFLGIVNDGESSRPHKTYQRPARPLTVKRIDRNGAVYAYLKSRGLTDSVLETFKISEENGQWIVFPYLRDGELVNIKYLSLERTPEGKKQMRQVAGAEPCLFGWEALDTSFPTARSVTLVEGEFDCLTLQQCGVPALSVPNGGGGGKKQDWIISDYERLSRFDTIYLAMDNDEPGKQAEREIIQRLGSERCRIVTLPHKDANECLQAGIRDFTPYLRSAKSLDPEELKAADYFTDAVMEKFYPVPGSYTGMKTSWSSFNEILTFDRRQLIIVTGFSESGKSVALGQIALQGLMDGEKFCIASFEMPGKVTLWRMVRQLCGEERPTPERIIQAMQWLRDKLWIFNLVGTAKAKRMLEVFKYAVKRYQIQQFVVDSLTKCGISEDDINGQKAFIEQLCDFMHEYNCTIYLVAHQRKAETDGMIPGKAGVRGSSTITDECDTLISFYRNEKEVNGNGDSMSGKYKKGKKEEEVREEKPDTVISILKNRETGKHGKCSLWFDKGSLQLHETRYPTPINYLSTILSQQVTAPPDFEPVKAHSNTLVTYTF